MHILARSTCTCHVDTRRSLYIREKRRSISSWRVTEVSSSGRRGSISLDLILRGSAAMKEGRREGKMINPLGIHENRESNRSIRESLLIDSIRSTEGGESFDSNDTN